MCREYYQRRETNEEAKKQIIAEERAFWIAKITQLEAKIDSRDEKAAPHQTHFENPHIFGYGSCSQTADLDHDKSLARGGHGLGQVGFGPNPFPTRICRWSKKKKTEHRTVMDWADNFG